MASKRVLRLPVQEREPKADRSIRASDVLLKRVNSLRFQLVEWMTLNGLQATPNHPFDFNADATLRLILRVFAKDYGFEIPEITHAKGTESESPNAG